MEFSTSSDDSSLMLPPPKKRWSDLSRNLAPIKKATKNRRPSRSSSWKMKESRDDPVSAPTASEVEVAKTLLKLTGKKTSRRPFKNYLRIPRPIGMAPLYGSYKEIEISKKATRHRASPLGDTSSQSIFKNCASLARVERGGSAMKPHEMIHEEGLTSKGASVMNAPYFVLPSLTPLTPSEKFTEGQFNQDLNTLHASAGKLTELMRTGQLHPTCMEELTTKIPPAVFKPEFHQEIEQVRSRQKRQMIISAQFTLFTTKNDKH